MSESAGFRCMLNAAVWKEVYFFTKIMGLFGEKIQAWLHSSPMWLSHTNSGTAPRQERFAQTWCISRCLISQAIASAIGPWAPFALVGFKFMEFYWQVGTSCLQTLSSLISVPWCCGQQLNLAETNQKHSSSLRKCAEFMLNLVTLFFPHCELYNFSDLRCSIILCISFWMVKLRYSFVQEKITKYFASFWAKIFLLEKHIILFNSSIVLKVTSA